MKTRKIILTTIVVIIVGISSFAQRNNTLFDNTYMGATYYGGSDYDYGWSIATDSENNFYVAGLTHSTDFPLLDPGGGAYFQGTIGGGVDGFIIKFNSDGVREWATYYGGNSSDYLNSIAVDENDNVLITGSTMSNDFPVFDPGGGAYFQGPGNLVDIFIVKFNSNGEQLWATCYGGNKGMQEGYSITSDLNNNIFVTGDVGSTNFPLMDAGGASYFQPIFGGSGDAFILKFNPSGVRQWATYYGSTSYEYGHSIAIDGGGNILITGLTTSFDFPVYDPGSGAFFQGSQAGNGDAFILKFSQDGARQWATYYGGSEDDRGHEITAGESNSILLTGKTWSPDLSTFDPGSGAYFQGSFTGVVDAFILKFNTGGVIEWGTYYGAANGVGITTDNHDNIVLTGIGIMGFSTFDPGGGAYIQESNWGADDACIIKFNNSLERIWATCYGGNDNDDGLGIATDGNNKILVSGMAHSTDFPVFNTTPGAYFQGTIAGGNDAFILCFDSNGVIGSTVGTEDMIATQNRHALYQNSPNPCKQFTRTTYFLSDPGMVQINLYNIAGRKIRSLVNQFNKEGYHTVEFKLNDLTPGLYFYDLKVDNKLVMTRRMEIIH